ncbi:hypothetical protein RYA60_09885, partial [Pseudomonas syringae]|nr:hypothetical protein [Pseudomonas syringae]
MLAALAQIESQVHAAVSRYGKDRVAVIMGTSTSGIAEGEEAVRHLHRHGQSPSVYDYQQQELGDHSLFMAELLDLCGPD